MSNTHPSELASNATEHKVASDHHYHMFRRTGSRAHAEAADAHEFAMHDHKHPQINTNQHIKAQADLSSKNARLKSVKANSGTNPKTFRKPMNESTIQIIEAIDAGKDFKASEIIEAALWEKVGNMIVEKKKKIVAKSFGSMKTNKETSDSLTKKSQRKALKTKLVGKLEKEPMHKLKFGGMSEENEAEHYKSLRDTAKSFNYAFSHAKEGKDVYKHSKPASLSIQHDGQGWGHGVHQNRVNGKNSTDLHKHLSSIHGEQK